VTYDGVITVSAVPSQTTHSPQAIPVTLRVITNVYQVYLQPILRNAVTPTAYSPITPTDPYYDLQWGWLELRREWHGIFQPAVRA